MLFNNEIKYQKKYQMKGQQFPEFDYSKFANKLCDAKTFTRVLREVEDTNADFKTLRTLITPTETIGVLHFVQYPADGVLADKPIFGRLIIPKYYPNEAPVIHIFTITGRFNVDAYHYKCYNTNDLSSSVCFDILTTGYGGTWNPDYTVSALLASLMQAIVSITVPQKGGGFIQEWVSMEKLESAHNNVLNTFNKYRMYIPSGRIIEKMKASPIHTRGLSFPSDSFSTNDNNESFLISDPIKLDEGPFSVEIDPSDLYNNRSTVFSIVLTNNNKDIFGKDKNTILFRNGITGTAATKKKGKPIVWFYHGIPFNDSSIRLNVTITSNQFTISYYRQEDVYIHGDYPVAYFRDPELLNEKFYLVLYLKNKNKGKTVQIIIKSDPNDEHSKGFIQNTNDLS